MRWRAHVIGAEASGEQPVAQHAVRGDPDAELATRRDDVVLRFPAEQGVLDLDVTDRMDGVGSTDRLRADLGQADPTDIAGLDHFRYRPDRLFDRDVRVEPAGR